MRQGQNTADLQTPSKGLEAISARTAGGVEDQVAVGGDVADHGQLLQQAVALVEEGPTVLMRHGLVHQQLGAADEVDGLGAELLRVRHRALRVAMETKGQVIRNVCRGQEPTGNDLPTGWTMALGIILLFFFLNYEVKMKTLKICENGKERR